MSPSGWVARAAIAALCAAVATASDQPVPEFDTPAKLRGFLLPATDDQALESLRAATNLDNAGAMIATAAKFGPANAAKIAATLPDPGFQVAYRDLARYLDLFGPCQKQQAKGAEGWWSGYPEPGDEHYCSEVSKLLLDNLLWTQAHYIRQLAMGEVASKIVVSKPAPWRLDEPPLKSPWLRADVLYAAADAALRFRFAEELRKRGASLPQEDPLRADCEAAATMLDAPIPDRERIGLALFKVLARFDEAAHLRHLDKLKARRP